MTLDPLTERRVSLRDMGLDPDAVHRYEVGYSRDRYDGWQVFEVALDGQRRRLSTLVGIPDSRWRHRRARRLAKRLNKELTS